jgi:hypothetical protein
MHSAWEMICVSHVVRALAIVPACGVSASLLTLAHPLRVAALGGGLLPCELPPADAVRHLATTVALADRQGECNGHQRNRSHDLPVHGRP